MNEFLEHPIWTRVRLPPGPLAPISYRFLDYISRKRAIGYSTYSYFYIMDISKKQLEESIIKVAVYIREDRSYEELMKVKSLPEICKYLAYDLFVRGVTESNAMNDTDVFTSIVMVRKYCQGLHRDGSFDFKSDIPGHGGL